MESSVSVHVRYLDEGWQEVGASLVCCSLLPFTRNAIVKVGDFNNCYCFYFCHNWQRRFRALLRLWQMHVQLSKTKILVLLLCLYEIYWQTDQSSGTDIHCRSFRKLLNRIAKNITVMQFRKIASPNQSHKINILFKEPKRSVTTSMIWLNISTHSTAQSLKRDLDLYQFCSLEAVTWKYVALYCVFFFFNKEHCWIHQAVIKKTGRAHWWAPSNKLVFCSNNIKNLFYCISVFW